MADNSWSSLRIFYEKFYTLDKKYNLQRPSKKYEFEKYYSELRKLIFEMLKNAEVPMMNNHIPKPLKPKKEEE